MSRTSVDPSSFKDADGKIIFGKKPSKIAKKITLDVDLCNSIVNKINKNEQIVNPATNHKIQYKSDITRAILSYCYYVNRQDNVLDVANKDDLFEMSSSSASASVAKSKVKTKTYNALYDIVSADTDIDKILEEHSLYMKDSKEIVDMIKNVRAIFSNIKSPLSMSRFQNTVRVLDDLIAKFKDACKSYIKSFNNIPIVGMNKQFKDILPSLECKLNDKCKITTTSNVYGVIYDTEKEELSYVSTYNRLYIANNINSVIISNTVFPKYFHYCDPNYTTSKKKDPILEHEVSLLIAFLNVFTKNIPDDIQIECTNHADVINKFNTTIYPSNDTQINLDIATCLVNHDYHSNKTDSSLIYNQYFIGPYYLNPMDYRTFMFKLDKYQPLVIRSSVIKEIEIAYKGVSPQFSRPLNNGLRDFITMDKKLDQNIHGRAKTMFQFVEHDRKPNYDAENVYIYHGTRCLMHDPKDTSVLLTSFLSCSFNQNVAIRYGTGNGFNFNIDTRKNGIVYVFKLKNDIIHINFNDVLNQVILPPGIEIKINGELNVGKIRYVLCDLKNYDSEYPKNLYKAIKINKDDRYSIEKFVIDKSGFPNSVKMDSGLTKELFRDNVPNIYLTDKSVKPYIYTSLGTQLQNYEMHSIYNIMYTIHQHIINDIYNALLPDHAVTYNILYNNDSIYTGWDYNNQYVSTINNSSYKYNTTSIIVDALVGNSGCLNNRNYLVLNTAPYTTKLVWMKGAGLYDSDGVMKNTFSVNTDTVESIILGLGSTKIDPNDMKTYLSSFETAFENFNISGVSKKYKKLVSDYMLIPKDSNEYKDIVKMIDNLVEKIDERGEFIKDNAKNIIKSMSKQGGKDVPYSSSVKSAKSAKSVKFVSMIDNNISSSSSSMNSNEYNDMVRNIPLSDDCYGVHTVSKAEFKKIAKSMARRAGVTTKSTS